MADEKARIIQEWPEPWKIKDIQSFLGFTNFYRWFIHNYSEITIPLTWLTLKGMTWNFTQECCSTFELLKKAFTSAPILMHWILTNLWLCKLMLWITLSQPFFPCTLWMVNFILLLSTLRPFPMLSWTMMFMTKSCWQFTKHSNTGDTTLRDLHSWPMLSPITRIWSTTLRWSFSRDNKHDGPNTSPSLTW